MVAMEEIIQIEEASSSSSFEKFFKKVRVSEGISEYDSSFNSCASAVQLYQPECESSFGIFHPDDAPVFEEVEYQSNSFGKKVLLKQFALQQRRLELEERKTKLKELTEQNRKEKENAKNLKEQKREQERVQWQQDQKQKEEKKKEELERRSAQREKDKKAWEAKNKKLFWRGTLGFSAYVGAGCLANVLLKKTKAGKVVGKVVEPLGLGSWIKRLFVPVGLTCSFGRYAARKTGETISKGILDPILQKGKSEVGEILDQTAGQLKKEVKEVFGDVENSIDELLTKKLSLVTEEIKLLKDEVLVDVDFLVQKQLIAVEASVNNIADNMLCNKISLATKECSKAVEDILCEKNVELLNKRVNQVSGIIKTCLVPAVKELSSEASGEVAPGLAKGLMGIPGRVLGYFFSPGQQATVQAMENAVVSGEYSGYSGMPNGFLRQ